MRINNFRRRMLPEIQRRERAKRVGITSSRTGSLTPTPDHAATGISRSRTGTTRSSTISEASTKHPHLIISKIYTPRSLIISRSTPPSTRVIVWFPVIFRCPYPSFYVESEAVGIPHSFKKVTPKLPHLIPPLNNELMVNLPMRS